MDAVLITLEDNVQSHQSAERSRVKLPINLWQKHVSFPLLHQKTPWKIFLILILTYLEAQNFNSWLMAGEAREVKRHKELDDREINNIEDRHEINTKQNAVWQRLQTD